MEPILCLVTDRHRVEADRLVALVAAAARTGIDLVQVREKDLEGRALTQLVAQCVDAVRGTRARVIVNDRLDVALAAGAHGVHLPSSGVPASRVRSIVPRGFLVGRSVHDPDEAAGVAQEGGLDYLIFGTVFPTTSKPGVTAAGLERLAATVAAVRVPVLAIGGVTRERIAQVRSTGAAGIAAIGLFADAWSGGELDRERFRI